ncbi:MAG: PDZ domain-containing protein [Phycisphaerales bacterium]
MKRSVLTFGCLVLWVLGSVSSAQDERGYMGVELDPSALPDLLTKHLGLEVGQGIRIRNITVDSPADRTGLERDDIIIVLQGEKITAVEQILQTVRAASVGDEVSLEIIHLGQRKTLQLKLGAAQEGAKLKYPPEPEAMMTWRPGKIFKVGPEGKEWMEIPFDRVPEFNVDVNKFFKEVRTLHHETDGEDYTITIEGDPKNEDSTVIVEAGDEEYRTTVGKSEAIPEKYRGQVREAIENARKDVHKDVIIERKLRLPEPPRPEVYQRYLRSVPRPDIERFSEQKDRVLEKLEEQMNRLQERMQSLEERNRELLDRLLDKKDKDKQENPDSEKPAPAKPASEDAI